MIDQSEPETLYREPGARGGKVYTLRTYPQALKSNNTNTIIPNQQQQLPQQFPNGNFGF
jgi:hypothetical protein